jgi:hypothetical protein
MAVIRIDKLNRLNLESASKSIADYTRYNIGWVYQFENFYHNTRINAHPTQRMNDLLTIVRYDGWSMNRQKQCESILRDIGNGKITNDDLNYLWSLVDNLPRISLSELPSASNSVIEILINSFTKIRDILEGWHSSAGSVCFLTKVVLMFNWGHTPAYDTRIRKILGVSDRLSNRQLAQSLVEIGTWIRSFENKYNITFDQFANDVMRKASGLERKPLPSGRSFDMMLFSLEP